MSDLMQSARVFEASARLQSASKSLADLADGKHLDHPGREALEWAGKFLPRLDWSSDMPAERGIGGGLAVQATSARPTFYASLLRIRPQFEEAAVRTPKELVSFLKQLYQLLSSGGLAKDGENSLQPHLMPLGAILLHELSQGLLKQLGNNGLPRRHQVLVQGLR